MSETSIDGGIPNRTRERSVAYPGVNLGAAVDLMAKLREGLGRGPYSRDEAVKGLGYSSISGASARVVAALVHYGLLARTGNTYEQADLAEEILHPVDQETKTKAIVQAASSPALFQRLLERYKGQALPSLLENILMRDGVSTNAAKEVASIFRETLQFAGLIHNGVVVADPQNIASIAVEDVSRPLAVSPTHTVRAVVPDGEHVFQFAGGVRMIIPRGNRNAEDAILDGELARAKSELKGFAEKHFGVGVESADNTNYESPATGIQKG